MALSRYNRKALDRARELTREGAGLPVRATGDPAEDYAAAFDYCRALVNDLMCIIDDFVPPEDAAAQEKAAQS